MSEVGRGPFGGELGKENLWATLFFFSPFMLLGCLFFIFLHILEKYLHIQKNLSKIATNWARPWVLFNLHTNVSSVSIKLMFNTCVTSWSHDVNLSPILMPF